MWSSHKKIGGRIMKKALLILLLFSLCGCSNKEKDEPDLNDINADIWGYDFNENQLAGSFSRMRNATESDKGVYFQITTSNPKESNPEQSSVLGYFDKTTLNFSIVDSSGDGKCSLETPKNCTTYNNNQYSFLNFYNQKLYYVENSFNDVGSSVDSLIEMDLDGKNRKKVAELANPVPASSSFSLLFHQGFLYYTYGTSAISRINLSNWVTTEITKLSGKNNDIIRAKGDVLYFTTPLYNDKELKATDALVSVNLSSFETKVLETELPIYQFTSNTYIYYNELDNTMNSLDKNTGDTKILKEGTGSVIFQNDYYVVSNFPNDNEKSLYLVNDVNDIIDVFAYEGDGKMDSWNHVITDGYLYTFVHYPNEKTEFIRMSVGVEGFGTLEIITTWPGSTYGG